MKLSVKTERFYLTPKPELSKLMFDWFWNNYFYNSMNYLPWRDKNFAYETIEIRLNRALPWTDIHFYIVVNGVYKFHIQGHESDFKKFEEKRNYDINRFGQEYYSRKKNFLRLLKVKDY